ncbi:YybH family protein [Ekhidna sp.]|uniref:YybH family protein n=1 Tax=Ekhidna sp. TaxID=2608089 RepID=UPI003B50B94A
MKYLIILIVLISSCSEPSPQGFTEDDQQIVNQMRIDYVDGWLSNDEKKVLDLFHREATIIPSGLSPIQGIQDIKNYWFPNDSSTTTIHSYDVELLNLKGTDSMAYSLEKGILNFTYTKADFTMTKSSTSHASTIYQKGDDGSWKIISRMWTQVK